MADGGLKWPGLALWSLPTRLEESKMLSEGWYPARLFDFINDNDNGGSNIMTPADLMQVSRRPREITRITPAFRSLAKRMGTTVEILVVDQCRRHHADDAIQVIEDAMLEPLRPIAIAIDGGGGGGKRKRVVFNLNDLKYDGVFGVEVVVRQHPLAPDCTFSFGPKTTSCCCCVVRYTLELVCKQSTAMPPSPPPLPGLGAGDGSQQVQLVCELSSTAPNANNNSKIRLALPRHCGLLAPSGDLYVLHEDLGAVFVRSAAATNSDQKQQQQHQEHPTHFRKFCGLNEAVPVSITPVLFAKPVGPAGVRLLWCGRWAVQRPL